MQPSGTVDNLTYPVGYLDRVPKRTQPERRTTVEWWPNPDGPYRVVLDWAGDDGRWDCVRAAVESDDAPITDAVYRRVRISQRIAAARPQVAGDSPRAGMRAATVAKLERVAVIYRGALKAHEPPTKAVARALGVTEAAASNLVVRARTAGFLPPTSPGMSVG